MLARLMLIAGLLLVAFLPGSANAERRVALVIGNSAYKNAATLRNPGNDAGDVAETLKKVGFEVLLGKDLDQQGFARMIGEFARALDEADVALFFYAGHGLQMNEKNYLVSVDARLENEFLLSSETIELDSIVRLMESKTAVNIVFLDACRNNPLAENLRRSLTAMKRSVSLGRGLARMEVSGRDTLIAFAAAPGQEASDGSDRNSPFTGALLKHLPKPGLEVSVMLKEVAADVRRDTRNGQRPQQLSDMTKTFYFAKLEQPTIAKVEAPAAPKAIAPPPAAASSGEDRALDMAFWNAAQSSNDCDAVRAYLTRFPQGLFVELAKLSERRLCTPGRNATLPAPGASAPPSRQPALAALPPPPEIAKPAAPDPALARDVQAELIRLGCATGEPKDVWNKQAGDAVRKFNRFAKAKLGADKPSPELIAALRSHEERVCPLECGRGTKAQGDVCVAVDRVEPPKAHKAEKKPERKRQERASREPPAKPRAPAERKGAGGNTEFASPLCQSRIQNSAGKWCCTYDPPRGPSIIICK